MEQVGLHPLQQAIAFAFGGVGVRGDLGGREFVAFWLDEQQRVLAGMNVNIWDAGDRIKELILSGDPVDPDRLADTSTPL